MNLCAVLLGGTFNRIFPLTGRRELDSQAGLEPASSFYSYSIRNRGRYWENLVGQVGADPTVTRLKGEALIRSCSAP